MSYDYRKWKADNCQKLYTQNGFMLPSAVEVELALVPPDNRKRDLDNYIKPVLDVLQGSGVVENDCMVKRLNVYWKKKSKEASGVTCVITECPPVE